MYKILWIIFVTLFIYSCGQNSSEVKRSDISNYDYRHIKANNGQKPNVGEFVYFQMDIYDDKDSLLQTYRNQKILPSVQILDPTDKTRKRNPVVDIISYMSLGDSVAIIVPVDSVPSMPDGFDLEHIEYHVTVAEILSEADHMVRVSEQRQKMEAEMATVRALVPEVEELTAQTLKDYKAGKLDIKETPNGVKYFIHELGTGEMPTDERMVTMQYYGRTVADANRFDDSFSKGRGYTFRLGRDAVIQGWHEIARYLPLGTRASVFIPSELGYGAVGSPPDIPAGAELYFYLVVEEVFI